MRLFATNSLFRWNDENRLLHSNFNERYVSIEQNFNLFSIPGCGAQQKATFIKQCESRRNISIHKFLEGDMVSEGRTVKDNGHIGWSKVDVGKENQSDSLKKWFFSRSEEHTSELQSLLRLTYDVF